MTLFMDVHTIEGEVTEADVAGAHAADLATQGTLVVRQSVDPAAGPPLHRRRVGAGLPVPQSEELGAAGVPGARCNRPADSYIWLDGYIVQAQCAMGVRHDHPDTAGWVESLATLAARTGMRGFGR
jgi:hypothetical protein